MYIYIYGYISPQVAFQPGRVQPQSVLEGEDPGGSTEDPRRIHGSPWSGSTGTTGKKRTWENHRKMLISWGVDDFNGLVYRENRKPSIFPWRSWGFPVSIFPWKPIHWLSEHGSTTRRFLSTLSKTRLRSVKDEASLETEETATAELLMQNIPSKSSCTCTTK